MSRAEVRILLVCTANVCRSPLASGLLRHRLDASFAAAAQQVEIASAGTRARPGQRMDPRAAALLPDPGPAALGLAKFASRVLDETLVSRADVVLTMTRKHRRDVVTLAPAAQRRTYTLAELARIARSVPPAHDADLPRALSALLARAPALRGPTAPPDPSDDDVADPFGLGAADYLRAASRLAGAVDDIVVALRPP